LGKQQCNQEPISISLLWSDVLDPRARTCWYFSAPLIHGINALGTGIDPMLLYSNCLANEITCIAKNNVECRMQNIEGFFRLRNSVFDIRHSPFCCSDYPSPLNVLAKQFYSLQAKLRITGNFQYWIENSCFVN